MLVEYVTGETPQAKIKAYLKAIQRQDQAAAREAWKLPSTQHTSYAELSQRREKITDELLALKITGFTIFDTQWWGTCCEPGVTQHARNAGGARVQVQVLDKHGLPRQYVMDVFTPTAYYGDAIGGSVRDWLLRDVYPADEPPLFWRWPAGTKIRTADASSENLNGMDISPFPTPERTLIPATASALEKSLSLKTPEEIIEICYTALNAHNCQMLIALKTH